MPADAGPAAAETAADKTATKTDVIAAERAHLTHPASSCT